VGGLAVSIALGRARARFERHASRRVGAGAGAGVAGSGGELGNRIIHGRLAALETRRLLDRLQGKSVGVGSIDDDDDDDDDKSHTSSSDSGRSGGPVDGVLSEAGSIEAEIEREVASKEREDAILEAQVQICALDEHQTARSILQEAAALLGQPMDLDAPPHSQPLPSPKATRPSRLDLDEAEHKDAMDAVTEHDDLWQRLVIAENRQRVRDDDLKLGGHSTNVRLIDDGVGA